MTRTHAFGPLELKILGLFAGDETLSATDVQTRLEAGDDALAYTTVMTVLVRLADKGALARQRDGKRYLYRTSRQATKLKAGFLSTVQESLFNDARLKPLAALLDADALSTEELRALRKLVDAKLKAHKP